MVPEQVVFREVVGEVQLAGFPEEIDFALVHFVVDPAAAHVKRFGKLPLHFEIEDAI